LSNVFSDFFMPMRYILPKEINWNFGSPDSIGAPTCLWLVLLVVSINIHTIRFSYRGLLASPQALAKAGHPQTHAHARVHKLVEASMIILASF
jgi:hypothetical protein